MKIGISKSFFDDLREIIEQKNEHKAKEILRELHPADIAEIYTELDIEEAKFLFLLLDPEMGADVVAELEEDDRERFLSALPEILSITWIRTMLLMPLPTFPKKNEWKCCRCLKTWNKPAILSICCIMTKTPPAVLWQRSLFRCSTLGPLKLALRKLENKVNILTMYTIFMW